MENGCVLSPSSADETICGESFYVGRKRGSISFWDRSLVVLLAAINTERSPVLVLTA